MPKIVDTSGMVNNGTLIRTSPVGDTPPALISAGRTLVTNRGPLSWVYGGGAECSLDESQNGGFVVKGYDYSYHNDLYEEKVADFDISTISLERRDTVRDDGLSINVGRSGSGTNIWSDDKLSNAQVQDEAFMRNWLGDVFDKLKSFHDTARTKIGSDTTRWTRSAVTNSLRISLGATGSLDFRCSPCVTYNNDDTWNRKCFFKLIEVMSHGCAAYYLPLSKKNTINADMVLDIEPSTDDSLACSILNLFDVNVGLSVYRCNTVNEYNDNMKFISVSGDNYTINGLGTKRNERLSLKVDTRLYGESRFIFVLLSLGFSFPSGSAFKALPRPVDNIAGKDAFTQFSYYSEEGNLSSSVGCFVRLHFSDNAFLNVMPGLR